ncbi:hypothetical protein QM565_11570 [Geitlerinema splendidum]|nr:hypothetical protein [Geitlerinema splendidum]
MTEKIFPAAKVAMEKLSALFNETQVTPVSPSSAPSAVPPAEVKMPEVLEKANLSEQAKKFTNALLSGLKGKAAERKVKPTSEEQLDKENTVTPQNVLTVATITTSSNPKVDPSSELSLGKLLANARENLKKKVEAPAAANPEALKTTADAPTVTPGASKSTAKQHAQTGEISSANQFFKLRPSSRTTAAKTPAASPDTSKPAGSEITQSGSEKASASSVTIQPSDATPINPFLKAPLRKTSTASPLLKLLCKSRVFKVGCC